MTEEFEPHLPGVEELSAYEVHRQLKDLKIIYYGQTPPDAHTYMRRTYYPIKIEEADGSEYPYNVLISGDLGTAKKILVKGMAWSDHPGRGFEALREALIADPANKLAVVGVSFPGAGLDSPHMTPLQRKSLKGQDGDFSYIGAQQWRAIFEAVNSELLFDEKAPSDNIKTVKDFEYILSGSSQGASNAVGMLQSVPEGIKVVSLGLAEETDLDKRSSTKFRVDYFRYGSDHFKEYTAVNPYNEYDPLGPNHNPFINAAKRPASHIGAVVGAMRRGGALDRIILALKEKELEGIDVRFRSGSKDKVASPLEQIRETKKFRELGKIAVPQVVIHQGHYHPYLENLANAQHEFRSFSK